MWIHKKHGNKSNHHIIWYVDTQQAWTQVQSPHFKYLVCGYTTSMGTSPITTLFGMWTHNKHGHKSNHHILNIWYVDTQQAWEQVQSPHLNIWYVVYTTSMVQSPHFKYLVCGIHNKHGNKSKHHIYLLISSHSENKC